MVHLLAAREYRPDASPLFYAANLAPDCIDIREIKDKTHFRVLSAEQREEALRELRDRSMGKGDFAEGIFLHLFLDREWDAIMSGGMWSCFPGPEGFLNYRTEIRNLSRALFRDDPKGEEMWASMEALPEEAYAGHPDFPAPEIRRFIVYNADRHRNGECFDTTVFTTDFTREFIRETVEKFREFIKE